MIETVHTSTTAPSITPSTSPSSSSWAMRARILSFNADPGDGDTPLEGSVSYFADGVLWWAEGVVQAVGKKTEK